MYIGKSDDIVNECNNIYHITIKMKLIDVKESTYIDFQAENNDVEFKVGEIRTFLQKVTLKFGQEMLL